MQMNQPNILGFVALSVHALCITDGAAALAVILNWPHGPNIMKFQIWPLGKSVTSLI